MRQQVMRTTKRHRIGRVALIACALAGAWLQVPAAQGVLGQWTQVLSPVPINPVHMALMNNGKVLIVAGSGNVATERNFRAIVWDPQAGADPEHGTFSNPITLAWDMFCNGMVALPDGQIFINGGNLAYDPFWGERRTALFDPAAGVFTNIQNMAHGRWYPTVTALGDGSIMTFSGLLDTGGTNASVEIYTPGSGWSPEYMAGWTPPLYPRMHLLTDGKVAYVGSGVGTRTFDPVAHTWSAVITNSTRNRNYGTSVLLPLSPADSHKSRVMIFGGGNPSVASTEIIDFSAATPRWQAGPPMSQPRIEMNATILPNGKVLATGGSLNDEDAATASLNADLYDPATNTFSPAGANAFPRLYHSNALLLPDATVLLAGGNPQRGNYEARMEIYRPAYLFDSVSGAPATRPVIQSLPNAVNYGGTFQVHTQDAANIASVVLVRPGAPTHAFDMDQRLVKLSYTVGSGLLNVTAPPDGNIAPPGYYMLFILNAAGVPSVAKFVQLSGTAPANQAPTATITAPAANVTINAGQAVSFAGSASDPEGGISTYAWTFAGGNPASSSAAAPGPVVYSTPGTYAASLMVTDEGGLTSPSVTRTITVTAPNFSMSAAPASQTVQPGGSAAYTLTVTPSGGFNGAVTFAASGVPSGASASFNPASVTSGTATMTVATTAATPPGTYQIGVTGTSGTLTRTANVTLSVTAPPNFSLSAAPASLTVQPGGSAAYTLTVAPSGGFSGAVTFTASGVPSGAAASFNPASVNTSGATTLTVATTAATPPGTYQITVTGTSGPLARTANVTLVVPGTFSLNVTPTSTTISKGGNSKYSVAITGAGFSGTVTLAVNGLPKFVNGKFTPATFVGPGTATLTVSSNRNVAAGTYDNVTVTATSGGVTQSRSVTLVVQ